MIYEIFWLREERDPASRSRKRYLDSQCGSRAVLSVALNILSWHFASYPLRPSSFEIWKSFCTLNPPHLLCKRCILIQTFVNILMLVLRFRTAYLLNHHRLNHNR
ncbi:hypothetical protein RF11_06308 [Thelohanellus kitauei]|uniref:Uncharacterized protein n=1 Tax=Thelohanellus kitauei TaxID=669202 RepID=A0A0C2MLN3_THEKT|nr:hypothetical protein RF11_06308 [Thelohanellus kitauei]